MHSDPPMYCCLSIVQTACNTMIVGAVVVAECKIF